MQKGNSTKRFGPNAKFCELLKNIRKYLRLTRVQLRKVISPPPSIVREVYRKNKTMVVKLNITYDKFGTPSIPGIDQISG